MHFVRVCVCRSEGIVNQMGRTRIKHTHTHKKEFKKMLHDDEEDEKF